MPHDRLISLILAVSTVVTSMSSCTPVPPKSERHGDFAIFLLRQGVSARQMSEMKLSDLELDEVPIVTTDDIEIYKVYTHEIKLVESAMKRITELDVTTTGRPFVVCVGDQRIYGGAFWVSWSSISYEGIVIDITLVDKINRTIRMQPGYPESPELFEGKDQRSDPRIIEGLRKAGKLR